VNDDRQLLQALITTAEVCSATLSTAGAALMVGELARFDKRAVAGGLSRCALECKGRLALADIVERLEDGRPGPEQAWAMCPKSEEQTAVWTEEIASAFFNAALPLLEAGDPIAARKSFLEAYTKRLHEARTAALSVKWIVSLGHDVGGREAPILAAVSAGRISVKEANRVLPSYSEEALRLLMSNVRAGPEQLASTDTDDERLSVL
jgi:hypothetical protein